MDKHMYENTNTHQQILQLCLLRRNDIPTAAVTSSTNIYFLAKEKKGVREKEDRQEKTRLAIKQKREAITSVGQATETQSLTHCCREHKMIQSLGKTTHQELKKRSEEPQFTPLNLLKGDEDTSPHRHIYSCSYCYSKLPKLARTQMSIKW